MKIKHFFVLLFLIQLKLSFGQRLLENYDIDITPNGRNIILTSIQKEIDSEDAKVRKIIIYSIEKNRIILTIIDSNRFGNQLIISNNSNLLILAPLYEDTLKVWNIETQELTNKIDLRTLESKYIGKLNLIIAENGKGGEIRQFFDVEYNYFRFGHYYSGSPTSSFVYLTDLDKKDGYNIIGKREFYSAKFIDRNKQIVYGSPPYTPYFIELFDFINNKSIKKIESNGRNNPLIETIFTNDSSFFFYFLEDKKIALINSKNLEIKYIVTSKKDITQINIIENKNKFYLETKDGLIAQYSLLSGKREKILPSKINSKPNKVSIYTYFPGTFYFSPKQDLLFKHKSFFETGNIIDENCNKIFTYNLKTGLVIDSFTNPNEVVELNKIPFIISDSKIYQFTDLGIRQVENSEVKYNSKKGSDLDYLKTLDMIYPREVKLKEKYFWNFRNNYFYEKSISLFKIIDKIESLLN